MRKFAKSWESMRKCAKNWESMRKCAKSWESVPKAEKVWESMQNVEKIWESRLNAEFANDWTKLAFSTKLAFFGSKFCGNIHSSEIRAFENLIFN